MGTSETGSDLRLLATSQAARMLGVSSRRVHQLVKAGQLDTALTTPLGSLYRAEDVERLAGERRRDGLARVP